MMVKNSCKCTLSSFLMISLLNFLCIDHLSVIYASTQGSLASSSEISFSSEHGGADEAKVLTLKSKRKQLLSSSEKLAFREEMTKKKDFLNGVQDRLTRKYGPFWEKTIDRLMSIANQILLEPETSKSVYILPLLGPPGIGKTSLIHDWTKEMHWAHLYKYTEFKKDQPNPPIEDLIQLGSKETPGAKDYNDPRGILVWDEFFRMKDYSRLSDFEREIRDSIPSRLWGILGTGQTRESYETTPNEFIQRLESIIASYKKNADNLEITQVQLSKVVEERDQKEQELKRFESDELEEKRDTQKKAQLEKDRLAAEEQRLKNVIERNKTNLKDYEGQKTIAHRESELLSVAINKIHELEGNWQVYALERGQQFAKAETEIREKMARLQAKIPEGLAWEKTKREKDNLEAIERAVAELRDEWGHEDNAKWLEMVAAPLQEITTLAEDFKIKKEVKGHISEVEKTLNAKKSELASLKAVELSAKEDYEDAVSRRFGSSSVAEYKETWAKSISNRANAERDLASLEAEKEKLTKGDPLPQFTMDTVSKFSSLYDSIIAQLKTTDLEKLKEFIGPYGQRIKDLSIQEEKLSHSIHEMTLELEKNQASLVENTALLATATAEFTKYDRALASVNDEYQRAAESRDYLRRQADQHERSMRSIQSSLKSLINEQFIKLISDIKESIPELLGELADEKISYILDMFQEDMNSVVEVMKVANRKVDREEIKYYGKIILVIAANPKVCAEIDREFQKLDVEQRTADAYYDLSIEKATSARLHQELLEKWGDIVQDGNNATATAFRSRLRWTDWINHYIHPPNDDLWKNMSIHVTHSQIMYTQELLDKAAISDISFSITKNPGLLLYEHGVDPLSGYRAFESKRDEIFPTFFNDLRSGLFTYQSEHDGDYPHKILIDLEDGDTLVAASQDKGHSSFRIARKVGAEALKQKLVVDQTLSRTDEVMARKNSGVALLGTVVLGSVPKKLDLRDLDDVSELNELWDGLGDKGDFRLERLRVMLRLSPLGSDRILNATGHSVFDPTEIYDRAREGIRTILGNMRLKNTGHLRLRDIVGEDLAQDPFFQILYEKEEDGIEELVELTERTVLKIFEMESQLLFWFNRLLANNKLGVESKRLKKAVQVLFNEEPAYYFNILKENILKTRPGMIKTRVHYREMALESQVKDLMREAEEIEVVGSKKDRNFRAEEREEEAIKLSSQVEELTEQSDSNEFEIESSSYIFGQLLYLNRVFGSAGSYLADQYYGGYLRDKYFDFIVPIFQNVHQEIVEERKAALAQLNSNADESTLSSIYYYLFGRPQDPTEKSTVKKEGEEALEDESEVRTNTEDGQTNAEVGALVTAATVATVPLVMAYSMLPDQRATAETANYVAAATGYGLSSLWGGASYVASGLYNSMPYVLSSPPDETVIEDKLDEQVEKEDVVIQEVKKKPSAPPQPKQQQRKTKKKGSKRQPSKSRILPPPPPVVTALSEGSDDEEDEWEEEEEDITLPVPVKKPAVQKSVAKKTLVQPKVLQKDGKWYQLNVKPNEWITEDEAKEIFMQYKKATSRPKSPTPPPPVNPTDNASEFDQEFIGF